MPNAPTTGPTPNTMPGAATSAPGTGSDPTNPNPGDGNTDEDPAEELSYEELQAEAEKWKTQARKNEQRAKANADKAKQFDTVAEKEWKAAWEREQAEKNKAKTPEQIKAEADAEAATQVQAAQAAQAEAEANFLRWKLASDKVPSWAMGLVTGTDEDTITEQIDDLAKQLEEWYVARLAAETNPRRPLPNPLAGRGPGPIGSTPREQFGTAFESLFNK